MICSPIRQDHRRATAHAMANKPDPVIFMSGTVDLLGCF
jgi:hypothetical protein